MVDESWYDFQDDGLDYKDGEQNFGLVRSDLMPKEPYYAIKSISHIIRTTSFVGKLDTGNDKVYALLFKLPDGKNALAM